MNDAYTEVSAVLVWFRTALTACIPDDIFIILTFFISVMLAFNLIRKTGGQE